MSLKISNENKEWFKKIYNNHVIINYVISYNNGFISFDINTTIDNMPLNFNELFKYSKKLEKLYESNNNENFKLLITINNHIIEHKNLFKIQYIEYFD